MVILWITMDVISFQSDGLIVLSCFKLKILFCMIVWLGGSPSHIHVTAILVLWLGITFECSWTAFVAEVILGLSFPTILNVKSFKFCWRRQKKVIQRILSWLWTAIPLRISLQMLQLWQIGSGIGNQVPRDSNTNFLLYLCLCFFKSFWMV